MGAESSNREIPAGDDTVLHGSSKIGRRGGVVSDDEPQQEGHALDLKSRADAKVLRRLIAKADVLVEKLRPRVIGSARFGYPETRPRPIQP